MYLARPKSLNQKAYISLGAIGIKFQDFVKQNNISINNGMNSDLIVKNNTINEIDYDKLKNSVEKLFPNPNQTGIGYLDIEGIYIMPLIDNEPDNMNFNKTLDLFINSIIFCKKLRPNIKWGHYGITFTRWKDKLFLDNNKKLDKLFKVVDVLFPSVYLLYDENTINFSENFDYIKSNIVPAIYYAQKYNKAVIPFVMHRFWSDKDNLNLVEMSDDLWEKYLKTVVSVSLKNKYVDGVTWWGADAYYYEEPIGVNVRKNLTVSTKDFLVIDDEYLIKKCKIFLNVLKVK